MDAAQAEAKIVALISTIEDARKRGDDAEVKRINDEVAELKKITGPRRIVGSGSIGG